MTTHYFECSWSTPLVNVWFCQHHTVDQVPSTASAKGLKGVIIFLGVAGYTESGQWINLAFPWFAV